MRRREFVQVVEDRPLDLEVFENRLDHEIRLPGRLAKVGRSANALERLARLLLRQPSFLDAPRDVALIGCARLAQLVLTLVVQDGVDAVQRGLLGDLRAHAARANDGEAGHCIQ